MWVNKFFLSLSVTSWWMSIRSLFFIIYFSFLFRMGWERRFKLLFHDNVVESLSNIWAVLFNVHNDVYIVTVCVSLLRAREREIIPFHHFSWWMRCYLKLTLQLLGYLDFFYAFNLQTLFSAERWTVHFSNVLLAVQVRKRASPSSCEMEKRRQKQQQHKKRADSYKLNEQSNYDEIRTRISSFIQHTQSAVIKIIEMNDSNGVYVHCTLYFVYSIWMARTKSMLITMKLTDFYREQN